MTDFNDLINSMIDEDEEDIVEDDKCLISNNKLEDDHITLICGHKFNYEPLFNEIKQQKSRINHLEITKLYYNQIKCPYCRNVQNKILPYKFKYKDIIPKIKYINCPIEYTMNQYKCQYKFCSGKRKNEMCNKLSNEKYCYNHYNVMIKRKEKEILKLKEKQDKKCKHILLKGKNKGKQCKCNINYKINESYCTKHFKLNKCNIKKEVKNEKIKKEEITNNKIMLNSKI